MYYHDGYCRITEERFWHNYFYRVFLIKQSSQLATLTSGRERLIQPSLLQRCSVIGFIYLTSRSEGGATGAQGGGGEDQQW